MSTENEAVRGAGGETGPAPKERTHLTLVGKDQVQDDDAKIYKPIEIPEQIRSVAGARFILLCKEPELRKKPREAKFLIDNNYQFDAPKLQGWVQGGGNYGILTGYGELHCFDADELDRLTALGVIDALPATFTDKTGSGGLHKWYLIPGMKKKLVMYDREAVDEYGKPLHLGEVQSTGFFAVGPGCLHKNGKRYEVIDNSPVATLEYEKLLTILKPVSLEKQTPTQNNTKTTNNKKAKHTHDVDITKIATPDNAKRNGEELVGGNPFHGSTGGRNFHMNPRKGVWSCFHHHHPVGGGWVELLAVKEGIIHCEDAGKGCLSKEQYKTVMRRAEELGLVEEEESLADFPTVATELFTTVVDELPREVPPEGVTVVKAPPRTGKTHAMVVWMKQCHDANYFTHRHAIIEHAIKIAREIRLEMAVWVVGLQQVGACRTGSRTCATCPMKPGQDNFTTMQIEARKLLWKKKILTVEDIPARLCPYYTLKLAEPEARYCFTVVNNISRVEKRENVFIDEDPTIDHFYPRSIELAVVKRGRGEIHVRNNLAVLEEQIDGVLKHGRRPRIKKHVKCLQAIKDVLEDEKTPQIDEKADRISSIIAAAKLKPADFVDTSSAGSGDEVSMEDAIRCLGHIYTPCPVSVVRGHGGHNSIYLVADEATPVYDLEPLAEAKRLVIIGATKAQRFAELRGGRCIEVESFRYRERFIVLAMGEKARVDNRGVKNEQKKLILEVAKAMWSGEAGTRAPFMVLTGSKRAQDSVLGRMKGAMGARDEREEALHWEYISGKPVVFFQNSVISRGLDVDQYNVLMVYDANFAQPFWSIADPAVAKSIIRDETTNSVLRISPTRRNDSGAMKLVLIPKEDVWKVGYLEGRIKTIEKDPAELARIIRHFKIAGEVSISKREFVKIDSRGNSNSDLFQALLPFLDSTEILPDQKELSICHAFIVNTLKNARSSKGRRMLNTDSLCTELQKTYGYNRQTAIEAIRQLYISGKLLITTYGRNKMWELSK